MSAKSDKANPEFSNEREFKVILESIEGQFKVFGEGLQFIHERLGRVEDRLVSVEGKIDRMEIDLGAVKAAIPMIFTRLTALETSARN